MPQVLGPLGGCLHDLVTALGLLALPVAPLLWASAPALAIGLALRRLGRPPLAAGATQAPYRVQSGERRAPDRALAPAMDVASLAAGAAGAASFLAALWVPLGLSFAPVCPLSHVLALLGVALFAEAARCATLPLASSRGARREALAVGIFGLLYVGAVGGRLLGDPPFAAGFGDSRSSVMLAAQTLSAVAGLASGALGALLLLALTARGSRPAAARPDQDSGRALPLLLGALLLCATVAQRRFLLEPPPSERVQASR